MNERIQHLSDIAYKNHLKNNPNSSFGRRADYDKEFAELIIRECVSACEGQATYDPQTLLYKPSNQFADAIKEHFGVE